MLFRSRVELGCVVTNQKGQTVLSGNAKVQAPQEKLRHRRIPAPRIQLLPA